MFFVNFQTASNKQKPHKRKAFGHLLNKLFIKAFNTLSITIDVLSPNPRCDSSDLAGFINYI